MQYGKTTALLHKNRAAAAPVVQWGERDRRAGGVDCVQDAVGPGGHALEVVLVAVGPELEGGGEVDRLLVKAL